MDHIVVTKMCGFNGKWNIQPLTGAEVNGAKRAIVKHILNAVVKQVGRMGMAAVRHSHKIVRMNLILAA